MSDELPEGWCAGAVGELVEFRYGKALPEAVRKTGRVPVYGSNGIVGSHSEVVTSSPSIIIGRKGSVGAVHYCDQPAWPIDTTYFVDAFGPFDAQFLAHQLRFLRLGRHESSTAIPGLSRDDVYAQLLCMPPLAEQHRIVAKVEALLGQVCRAKDRLDRVPLILKRFRQAVLAAACSGKMTAEWRAEQGDGSGEWQESTVSDVCEAIVDCPHSTPKWTERGEVCLRTTNFTVGGLELRTVRHVSRATFEERVARLRPEPGDVVYSREGGILGIACVIPAGLRACLGQRMMLLRPDPRRVRSHFLAAVLNSPNTNQAVRELTGGTASPHLNVADIKRFAVPVPSLAEQDAALTKLSMVLALSEVIAERVRRAESTVVALQQAILAKAFAGELAPTEAELARAEGRDYETADQLLERVRTQSAGPTVTGKRGRSASPRVRSRSKSKTQASKEDIRGAPYSRGGGP